MRRTLMSALIATLAPNAAFSDALPSFPMFMPYQSARQKPAAAGLATVAVAECQRMRSAG
jgi:hypothetical protein